MKTSIKTYLSKFISFQLVVLLDVILFMSAYCLSNDTNEHYKIIFQVSFYVPELIVFLVSFVEATPHFKYIDKLLKL